MFDKWSHQSYPGIHRMFMGSGTEIRIDILDPMVYTMYKRKEMEL